MSWDYFISHASEDKLLVAAPLAYVLSQAGFHVWYDDYTLPVGSSLKESIDKGLQHSRFGIVILSPAFFARAWPKESRGNNLIK
jgi:hypothetical protein